MIIDIHAHIAERSYFENLQRSFGLEVQRTPDGKTLLRRGGHTVAWSREDMFDTNHRLHEMDRKKIDLRVLSLSAPNIYYWKRAEQVTMARLANDSMASLCSAHPDRFLGLASLPLNDVEASLAELDRCIDVLGMKGVMIGSNINGIPVNDPRFEPLWARIDELGLPVFEHPMHPRDTADMEEFELSLRVGLIFDTTLAATRLIYGGVFDRYPHFPYIMAHTGGALLVLFERLDNGYRIFPDCRKFISKLPSEYLRRLYYDTAAFDPEVLLLAVRLVGSDHLLLGTDDPFIDSDTRHVDQLPIGDAERGMICGGTAARLLRL